MTTVAVVLAFARRTRDIPPLGSTVCSHESHRDHLRHKVYFLVQRLAGTIGFQGCDVVNGYAAGEIETEPWEGAFSRGSFVESCSISYRRALRLNEANTRSRKKRFNMTPATVASIFRRGCRNSTKEGCAFGVNALSGYFQC